MALENSIVITSEREAWETLESLLKNRSAEVYVEFSGWPTFDLVVKGERYASSIPANLLNKLSSIQGSLNTFYGRFVYDGDARNLKKYEKHEIELVYEVKKGSTEVKADATGLLNKMGEAMAKPSTQKIAGITLCVLALIVSGAIVISKKSSDNRDIEMEKLKLLQEAVKVSPELKDTSRDFQDLFREIITSAADAKNISIGPQNYNEQKIQELAARNRSRFERVELSGTYRIKSIRGYQNHYLIDIQINKDNSIRARLPRSEATQTEIDALVMSITSHASVSMVLLATKFEDGYANARIKKINV
ncbi:hypothetical protein [Chromobacterium violaceum]|uniref:hypothetical protein n=1 Tax=Chromobacterium violaceum TaxID=536 RepID=UPI000AB383C8|nr:hypothetical protein [Chromobacterium violaceum]